MKQSAFLRCFPTDEKVLAD